MVAHARLGDQPSVSRELGIASQTVKNHLTRIYAKLGVHSWLEAMFVMGWVRIPTETEVDLFTFSHRFALLQAELDAITIEARAIANDLEQLAPVELDPATP